MITQGTPIAEVRVGDEILTSDGRVSVASIMPNGPFYQVELVKNTKLSRTWFFDFELVHKVIEG